MFMLIVLLARIIVTSSIASCTVLMVMWVYAMASRRRACVGLVLVRLRISRAVLRAVCSAVHAKRRGGDDGDRHTRGAATNATAAGRITPPTTMLGYLVRPSTRFKILSEVFNIEILFGLAAVRLPL